MAEKTGLGSENLHKFIEILFPGTYTMYSNRLRSGDYHKRQEVCPSLLCSFEDLLIQGKPLFAVDLARKDARHALKLASDSGARIRDVEVADGHLADVQKHAGSKGDITGIFGAVRQEAGLPYEN